MHHRLQPAARARDIWAVDRDLLLVAFYRGSADRAARGGDRHRRFAALLAAVGERRDDLRDDLSGSLDLHPIADAEILFGNQVEIVERGELDRGATDLDGFQHGVRIERAGAADVDADAEEAGDGDIGRELPGDCPARFASADDAELLLERQRVDFDHTAVDREVERGADAMLHLVGPGCDVGERAAAGPVGSDRDAPARKRVQEIPLGAEREARPLGGRVFPCGGGMIGRCIADRDGIAKESQRAAGGDRGIQLPEGAGRRVAGVRENGVAFCRACLIHLLEPVEGHVHLAPHLDDRGRRRAFGPEAERDIANRAEIGRDVLADRAVAPGGAGDEYTIAIRQADRCAIDLELGRVSRLVDGIARQAFYALIPGRDFVIGEGVAERQHRHQVGVLGQLALRRCAEPLGW